MGAACWSSPLPFPPDADDIEVGDPADLELEGQLGHPAGIRDLPAQDVALLLALDTLKILKFDRC